jgi:hypothetical protein
MTVYRISGIFDVGKFWRIMFNVGVFDIGGLKN